MTPQQSTRPTGWFSGRTRLITIASIVAVGVAGATAVSANMGILNAASDTSVGTVSAAGDLTPPPDSVIDVYLPGVTSTTAATTPSTTAASVATASGVQEFAVDVAGTVAVASTADGLRLDSVTPAAGWTWSLSQNSSTDLMVTMTDGARTLEFVATATADGHVTASVNEPVITPAPPVANTGGSGEHEEYEGGDDDD